ncbi:MAG: hypothetical protein U0T56_08170 [Ferruginibacter sp.]
MITSAYARFGTTFNFVILGSGDPNVEAALTMRNHWFGYYHSQIEYTEKFSHQLYAGADFLLMPSRVEPCGLNQMYSMRYGTVPMVRRTGGLNDTVIDIGDWQGYGLCFSHASLMISLKPWKGPCISLRINR